MKNKEDLKYLKSKGYEIEVKRKGNGRFPEFGDDVLCNCVIKYYDNKEIITSNKEAIIVPNLGFLPGFMKGFISVLKVMEEKSAVRVKIPKIDTMSVAGIPMNNIKPGRDLEIDVMLIKIIRNENKK